MTQQAIVTINESTYNVLHCNYSFGRKTDSKGRPGGGMQGGRIIITLESEQGNDDFFEMFKHAIKRPVKGKLEIWKDNFTTRLRTLEWEEGFVYEVGELMTAHSPLPMIVKIAISPLRLDINRTIDR